MYVDRFSDPDFNTLVNMVKLSINNSAEKVREDTKHALDAAFDLFEKERILDLTKLVKKKFIESVIPCCTKVHDLDSNGSLFEIPSGLLDNLCKDLIHLGEQEPYGVLGGTLILNFGSVVDDAEIKEEQEDHSVKFIKIGRFSLNPDVTSTFELHWSMFPSNKVKHKLANLARKLQGKPSKIVVSESYILVKKKLYRSPSDMKR